MAIQVTCACGRTMSVPVAYSGKAGCCPKCGAAATIPVDPEDVEPGTVSFHPVPARVAFPWYWTAARASVAIVSWLSLIGMGYGLVLIFCGLFNSNIDVFLQVIGATAGCFVAFTASAVVRVGLDAAVYLRELRDAARGRAVRRSSRHEA